MIDSPTAISQISLVAANFGNAETFSAILEDWFRFLGGKPGEVVIVDGGSDQATQAMYWKLYCDGKIDKLQVIRPTHPDNNKDLCFIQEHTAGAIASKPYLLWFKSDTLPFRQGHDNWLSDAVGYLDRDDTFAVGGSFNIPSKHHDAWPGWYFSHKCSENFALMKRENFIKAMEEFAGEYIASGFRGMSPAQRGRQARYLVEVAFEQFIAKHEKYTLVKVEDPTWTVFHTNVLGPDLVKVREDYLARRDVEKYMNAQINNRIWGGCYYGKPALKWDHFKWTVGDSPLGPVIRAVKRAIGLRPQS
ncbi:MAG: hypothetical protein M3O30_13360 [Planctomycetota bacterium]|nr:hypothetical protein [Planctomycetota bacterium]